MRSQIKHNYFNMNEPLETTNSELKLVIPIKNSIPKQFLIKKSICSLHLQMITLKIFHSP